MDNRMNEALEDMRKPDAQISLAGLFIFATVILVMIAVAAILFLGYTQPEKDHTTTITLLLGLLTPILTGLMFLVNKQNEFAQEAMQERREARRQMANAQRQIQQVSNQVAVVAEKTDSIEAKADESIVTTRAGLAAFVKAAKLAEFDLLLDKFVKGSLTQGETERLAALVLLRETDDLTDIQRQQLLRVKDIVAAELKDPNLQYKKKVDQTHTETADAKEIQAKHEVEQKATGARKEHPDNGTV